MDGLEQGKAISIKVDFDSLSIPLGEIAIYMGYGDHEPDPRIRDMVASMKGELSSLCRPAFGYCHVDGHAADRKTLVIGGKTVNPGGIITNYLKDSDSFILLAATAGSAYDHWRKRQEESGDIVRQYVADALGSAIAEAVAARAQEHLSAIAVQSGLKITNSYSPGYCGWNVREQQILFSLLPPGFCGITLTASSLMLPVKSVSAVLGIGRNVEKKPYGCAICRKRDCFKRRLPKMEKTSSVST